MVSMVDIYYFKDVFLSNLTSGTVDLFSVAIGIYLFLVAYAVFRLAIPFKALDWLVLYVCQLSKIVFGQTVVLTLALYFKYEETDIVANLLMVIVSFIGPWGLLAYSLANFLNTSNEELKTNVALPVLTEPIKRLE